MYPINHHYSLTVALPLLLSAQVSFAETPLDNIQKTQFCNAVIALIAPQYTDDKKQILIEGFYYIIL